jgi:hypothetical protein
VVVGTPVDDGLFDGLRLHVLGEGLVDEGREFGVGREAQGDELFDGEFVDVAEVGGGQQGGEAEALFEPDDAVLCLEGGAPGAASHHDEDDGHDNTPEMKVLGGRPVVDGDVDGEDEVQEKKRNDDKVEGRVVARVILQILLDGHEQVLLFPG